MMFITALFIIAKLWKQPRCPTTDEWIKKLWYIYTMEYYSAMWFEGTWMRLEDIMLTKPGSETQKPYVFSHMWKIDPKINIYTKTSITIYKLTCRTCLKQWNCSMELRERGKGKGNDKALVISQSIRCEGRGYKDTY
jgi:hypothetical protein